jgi:HEAT repeat protein
VTVTTDTDFETALGEAVDSLRTAHRGAAPDEASIEPLVEAIAAVDPDDPFRDDAARILAMLAEEFPTEVAPIAPRLAESLGGDGTAHLLRALGYVSEADPDAVRESIDPVAARLDADDPAVVRHALWTLSNVAEADSNVLSETFPELAALLSHEDGEVRRRATIAIANVPTSELADAPSVLDRLLEVLESPNHYRSAGRTLVAVAPAYGDRLVEALFERLDGGTPSIREHVAWTLAPLADEHPELLASRRSRLVELVVESDDYQVKNGAAAALAALAVDDPSDDSLAEIAAILDDPDEFTRRYGCLALGDLAVTVGHPDALDALADAAEDGEPVVEREAARLLTEAADEHPEVVAAVAPAFVDRASK